MQTDTDRIVRKVYGEIIAGYSFADFLGKTTYIKHFGVRDTLEYDYKYNTLYQKYLKGGVLGEAEKLELIRREDLWPEKQEKRITEIRETITSIQNTKRNHFSLKEIDNCNKQIKQNYDWLLKLITEKAQIIGETAESMARRNMDAEQIVDSFYKDRELTVKWFDNIDDLSESELNQAFQTYETFTQEVSDTLIKRVALSSEFQAGFSLCDNIYYFFGVPIAYLTSYQNRLLEYGNYYKSMFSSGRIPPEDARKDPDKLEDWFFARQNVEKIIAKDEGNGKQSSLFGVTTKELKYLGIEVDNSHLENVQKMLKASGGELSGAALHKLVS